MADNMPSVANPFAAPAKTNDAPTAALAASDEARSIAEVQAMMVIAKKFPRDPIKATDKILQMCTRAKLAETALYSYSRGGTEITGPSIRLAEAVAQAWGNLQFGFRELSRGLNPDGSTYSDVEAYAWDLETNTRRPVSFRQRHWRDTRNGGYAITDERDIYELIANQAQRRVRACILAILPGDVVEAAETQVYQTLKASADTSKEGIEKMLAVFADIGVTKEMIEARIQCRISAIRPAQMIQLRNTYNSIRDGMSTPADWFEIGASSAAQTTSGGTATDTPDETDRPALPSYPAEQFAIDLAKWRDLIEAGKQTAENLAAIVGSKYALTDDQIAQIKADPATGEIPDDVTTPPPRYTDEWMAGYNNQQETEA